MHVADMSGKELDWAMFALLHPNHEGAKFPPTWKPHQSIDTFGPFFWVKPLSFCRQVPSTEAVMPLANCIGEGRFEAGVGNFLARGDKAAVAMCRAFIYSIVGVSIDVPPEIEG